MTAGSCRGGGASTELMMYFLDFILFIHLQLEYEQLASAMPSHPTKTAEEASGANKEALRGGVVGAAKWGLIGGGLALAGFYLSPVYRNLTFQFKVYIQISFMTMGGMIEADRRLRVYEFQTRLLRKRKNDQEVWSKWEDLLAQEERLQKAKKEREKPGG